MPGGCILLFDHVLDRSLEDPGGTRDVLVDSRQTVDVDGVCRTLRGEFFRDQNGDTRAMACACDPTPETAIPCQAMKDAAGDTIWRSNEQQQCNPVLYHGYLIPARIKVLFPQNMTVRHYEQCGSAYGGSANDFISVRPSCGEYQFVAALVSISNADQGEFGNDAFRMRYEVAGYTILDPDVLGRIDIVFAPRDGGPQDPLAGRFYGFVRNPAQSPFPDSAKVQIYWRNNQTLEIRHDDITSDPIDVEAGGPDHDLQSINGAEWAPDRLIDGRRVENIVASQTVGLLFDSLQVFGPNDWFADGEGGIGQQPFCVDFFNDNSPPQNLYIQCVNYDPVIVLPTCDAVTTGINATWVGTLNEEVDCPDAGGHHQPYVHPPFDCVADIPPPVGKCCLSNYLFGCVNTFEYICNQLYGYWFGIGTQCDGPTCEDPGACCFPDGRCEFLTRGECAALGGGSFTVPGLPCDAIDCNPGACCLLGGYCGETSIAGCEDWGGVFRGVGVLCEQVECPSDETGVCCFPHACHDGVLNSVCEEMGGVAGGTGSVCSDLPCPFHHSSGACCHLAGGCSHIPEHLCDGIWHAGQFCLDVVCPPTGGCCLPSGNCVLTFDNYCAAADGEFHEGIPCNALYCVVQPG